MGAQALTERFEMRLAASLLEEVDAWRARQKDMPSRAEAIRRLIEAGLAATGGKKEIALSDGEKLILFMLRDIFKQLKFTGAEIDPDFVAEIISGGHYWGLEWKYTGVFHSHSDAKAVVSEVVDILEMWSILEDGYRRLSTNDKAHVEAETAPFGIVFTGFDGNTESEHLGVARFLVDQLERFTEFTDRDLNAHMPTIHVHRRMLSAFAPIWSNLRGRPVNASEIIAIVKGRDVFS